VRSRAARREREYTAPRLYEIAFDMNRKGADTGPRDLRLASDSIEPSSPWA